MEERRPHHTYKIQRRLSNTPAKRRRRRLDFDKKMIRAAHAKEKQLLEKSRNRPNRLNLSDSTACSSARSNFFTKNSCLVRFPMFQGLDEGDRRDPDRRLFAETLVALQKICLYKGRNSGCFVAHLLKK